MDKQSITRYMIRRFGRKSLRFYRSLSAEYVNPTPTVIHVDPQRITKETRTNWGSLLDEPGLVLGGPWDKFTTDFDERQKVRALRVKLEDGAPWDETDYYDRILQRIESGRSWRGCENENDLRTKLAEYELIHDEMCESGYKTQKELDDDDFEPGNLRIGEIGVNIGRGGELFWQDDGQSRLTLAKILELDKVPVEVLTRHKRWWQLRVEIASCDSSLNLSRPAEHHLDHPDMKNI